MYQPQVDRNRLWCPTNIFLCESEYRFSHKELSNDKSLNMEVLILAKAMAKRRSKLRNCIHEFAFPNCCYFSGSDAIGLNGHNGCCVTCGWMFW